MTPNEILAQTEHRPFPLPGTPWVMRQTWHDLLFAPWALPPDQLRAVVPPEFELDLFDGKAWVGVIPFHMSDVRVRATFSFPMLSAFPELNVRTYVTYKGQPGVHFFSLDAFNPFAVWGA